MKYKTQKTKYKKEDNPFFNKQHTEETKEKIRNSDYHKNLKGNKHPHYIFNITKKFLIQEYVKNKKSTYQIAKELGHSDYVITDRLRKYGIYVRTRSEAHKGKHSSPKTEFKKGQHMGKDSLNFGKPIKPKWGRYKDINMRSSWEIKFAKYLDKKGIKWQYEPKTFDLGNTTYTPDFELPNNVYVEIKGYMSETAYFKIKKFLRQYSDIKLQILMQKDLQRLGILKEK